MSGHQPLPIDRQEPGAGQDLRLLMDHVATLRPCSQWLPTPSRSRPGEVTAIGLGWRVHSWWAVVVAVSGPPHRRSSSTASGSRCSMTRRCASLITPRSHFPPSEVPALIDSVEKAAAAATVATIRGFISSLGPVAAVGVVGRNRRPPTELPRILASHARMHASERDLYEQAVIQGTARAGLPVTTIPATGTLFNHASHVLGVAIEPSLAALGKSIGPPWQKDHKEATAAALVALEALS